MKDKLASAINWLKDKYLAYVGLIEAHPWYASFIIVGLAALNGWQAI